VPGSDYPPAGFAARTLPIEVVDGAVTLFRSHPLHLDPVYFSVGHSKNRFDDPNGKFGVCYCALTPEGAFAESFLRQRTGGFVDASELEIRSVAELAPTAPLRLVPFYGAGLAKLLATAAVTAGAVTVAQAWSRVIYDHPDKPDGILYRVRHDDDQIGMALFQRGEPMLSLVKTQPWRHHFALDTICDRYELIL